MSEDLEGAYDVEVNSDESATEPFIDFVFLEEFNGVVELKVILLSVLLGVISDLKEVLSSKVLILHYYKTRGRVFLNQGSIMQEHNQKLIQYFILDFQRIISYCNIVICLVWICFWVWLGLVVHHYPLFRIFILVFEIV